MKVHVGTSGYNYPEWRGTFYPEKCPSKAMFAFYSARFTSVEINYTFYRLPTAKITEGWRAQAPAGFTYALKAPRRITHDRRLQDCADLVAAFSDNARAMGEHLGPLLFQLPPHFKCDVARLEAFLSLVPADLRSAFEFRHDSWLAEPVYEVLRRHGAALCTADFGDKTTPLVPTARHGYFRLRDEGYTTADIARWVEAVAARAADWDHAFVYFKHEEEGKGPAFARTFIELATDRGLTLA
jgi:uncharacterized protein YecE (DUF72 family)